MRHTTPFFAPFRSLLFGKPPVSPLKQTLATLSQFSCLSQLQSLFDPFIPKHFLRKSDKGFNSRTRVFSLPVVFWGFLDQVQTPNASCRETVRKVIASLCRKSPNQGENLPSPDTSAYCQARAKLPTDLLDNIQTHLVDNLLKRIPTKDLWHGRHVRVVDGTGLSMADTPSNQAVWPQSKSQKPGCGFPSMNLVGLFCLLSGALIKTATSDRHVHESMLFQTLWNALNPGDVLLADRGFCSFATVATLHAQKVDSLMRLPEYRFRKAIGAQLPKSANFDVIVTWKRPKRPGKGLSKDAFCALPESMPIRVIRYSLARAGFRTQSVTLVTTLLDASISASDLADLYCRRWNVELRFREIKISLNMDVLRCRSPHMIERELRMHIITYNLVRSLIQNAAISHDCDLPRISFKGALDSMRQFANAAIGAEDKPKTISALLDEMLLVIAQDLVPLRPKRNEPRVRKRRPKNFRLMVKPRHPISSQSHKKSNVDNNSIKP